MACRPPGPQPPRSLPPRSLSGHLGREQLQFGGKEMKVGQIAQDQFGQGRGLDPVPFFLAGSRSWRWLRQSLCRARARGSGTTIVTGSPRRPMTTWENLGAASKRGQVAGIQLAP